MIQEAEAYFQKSRESYRAGDLKASLAALDKAITIDPNNHEYYMARGDLRYMLDEYGPSIEDFTKVIDDSQDLDELAEAHSKMLVVYHYWSGHTNEVIEELNWIIAHGFGRSNDFSWRGLHMLRLGLIENAISDYSAAYELASSNDYLLGRAHAFYAAQYYEKAIDDLTLILDKKDPLHPSILAAIYHWRAKAYRKLNIKENALSDANQEMLLRNQEPFSTFDEYITKTGGDE
ncbi:MAG: hypothetical protein ABI947_29635 [Chloroflexota bacterium]